jgi:hypothetical protein
LTEVFPPGKEPLAETFAEPLFEPLTLIEPFTEPFAFAESEEELELELDELFPMLLLFSCALREKKTRFAEEKHAKSHNLLPTRCPSFYSVRETQIPFRAPLACCALSAGFLSISSSRQVQTVLLLPLSSLISHINGFHQCPRFAHTPRRLAW